MELDINMELESPSPGLSCSVYASSASHQQRQQQARMNVACNANTDGAGQRTVSAVSTPPDTLLLSAPVSPVHGFANTSFTSCLTESSSSGFSTALTTPTPLQPLDPPALDSVHLLAKGSNTPFHPYARKQGSHHFNPTYALRTHGLDFTTSTNSSGVSLGLSVVQQQQPHVNYSTDFAGGLATANAMAPLEHVTAVDGEDSVHGGEQLGLLFRSTSTRTSTGKKGSDVRRTSTLAARSSRTMPAQSRSGSPTLTGFPAGTSKLQKSASISGASSSRRAPLFSTPPSPPSQTSSTDPNAPPASTTALSRPAASLLSKPFKCPTAGCVKSYKQANGLKYHVTRGLCTFTPPLELSSIVILTKREVERKLRPYCCQVSPCTKRYKNIDTLMLHYEFSGDHGARGLAMLASGTHDPLKEPTWVHEDKEDGEGSIISAIGGVTGAEAPPTPTSVPVGAASDSPAVPPAPRGCAIFDSLL